MAQEGVAAALQLSDDILNRLREAQKIITEMSNGAQKMADSFKTLQGSITGMAQGLKGTGVAFESVFDKSGALKNIKIISEAIQQSAKSATAVVKTEAQKQAEAAERAAKRSANAQKQRDEAMKRNAGYLSAEAQNALAANPKGLEQMKEQLKQLTSLQRRFNQQVIKGNPYIDPNMSAQIGSAINQLKNNISSVNTKIKSLNLTLNNTSKDAAMVRSMLTMAFNPLLVQRFLQQMITIRGEFELAQRSLAVIIRDEGKARDMFNEITQIAVKSPFSVSDLLKQTKQLAAYRIETDKLIDTTKMLGDISAGVGVDMQRLILAYGQVKAAEFLKGTELRQFSEAGVNMLGGLADRFSELYGRVVSVGEVMQMVSKRMVKFADVEAVLKQATEAGGTFYKMQEKQAETLRGRITNLGDRIQIMFNTVGQSYDGLMAKVVTGLENMVSNWKAVSNVLVPLLGGKMISGAFGLIGQTTLFKTISTYTQQATKEMLKMQGSLTLANRAGIALKGTMAGIGKVISANWVTVIAALALAIVQAYRNATQLERELKKIVDDFEKLSDQQVDRYEKLLDIALDVTKTERERQEALDAMKAEYGNIIDIQKVELANIEQLNNARQQHIELIRQQAYEEARAKAESSLISDLSSSRQGRINRMSTDIDSLINQYKKQIKGLQDLSDKEIKDAMMNAEKMLISGTISTTTEARDEFLKMILTISGATKDEIASVLGDLGPGSFAEIQRAFDAVLKGMEKIDDQFAEATTDFSISRNAEKYRDAIKRIADIDAEFQKNLSNEDKLFYKQNPAQQRLDVLRRIQMYADLMHQVIGGEGIDDKTRYLIKSDLGEIGEEIIKDIDSGVFEGVGEEAQKVLNRELESALRKVAPEADTDMWMLRLMSKLNKEFSTLKRPFQGGMVRWENGQDEEKFLKTINAELEEVEKMQRKLKSGNEREVMDVVKAFGDPSLKTAAERIESAKIALMDYSDALERLRDEGGFFGKTTATQIKERATAIEALARDVINLADGWWMLTEEEKKNEMAKIGGRAFDLKIEPPTDANVAEIRTWLDNFVAKELKPAANFDLHFALDREEKKELKGVSDDISGIFSDIVDYYKKTFSEKLPREVGDSVLKVINNSIADFNKNPNKATQIELPVTFSLEGLRQWLEKNKDNFSDEALRDAFLSLFGAEQSAHSDANQKAQKYKSDLKAFLTDLKKARKEMDKLTDEEDRLFVQKLQHQGKKVGVKIADDFEPTKEVLDEIINKYLPKLDEADKLELRLSWSKEDTADTIQDIANEANKLWDQYDNAKKLEQWGLIPSEGSSRSIMEKIYKMEEDLRKIGTEEAIKAAETVAKKRIEIARSEQEEAAKIMYEAQKKSLDKVGQAYRTMAENITKIRAFHNPDERDAAVNAQIAKSMKEIADAQWDAYKSTEMYTVAFGNLEGMSKEALMSLRTNLEAWKEYAKDALQPTEMQAVIKQINKINLLLEEGKTKEVFGGVVRAFKEITEAGKLMRELPVLEQEITGAQLAYVNAVQATAAAEVELNKLDPVLEAEEYTNAVSNLMDAQYNEAQAQENATEATNNYSRAQAAATSKTAAAQKRLSQANDLFSAYSGAVSSAINFSKDFAEAFGLSFSKEGEAAIEGVSQGMGLIGSAIAVASAAMTAYDISTKIAVGDTMMLYELWWPMLAVMVAIAAAVAIFKARDAALEAQVEAHKDVVEKLQKAYDKLKKAMDEAMDASRLRTSFAEMNANLNRQQKELEEAIEANNQRKQTDEVKDETEQLEEQLDELKEKAADLKDEFYEALGVENDSRGLAQSWAKDWLSAFKETGSGLDALREDFDDLYDDLVVGQLWSQIMGPQIEMLQNMIKNALADSNLSDAEAAAIRAFRDTLTMSNAEMEARAKQLGISAGSLAENGLQRGVETVTEQTASALESILNGVRYDVSDTNAKMANIEIALTGEGENTILSQLRSQTRYLADIAKIASAVYYSGGHPKGAGALKVITEMA